MPVDYSPEQLIKNTAHDIGFSEVGIAGIQPSAESDRAFDRWLGRGFHGEMRYLSGGADKRHKPDLLLGGARSVICVGVNYHSESRKKRNAERANAGEGTFSVYAHGRDYHDVITGMLRELEARLRDVFPEMDAVASVDTQPISDRDFALRAGIAWLGKNTCAISPSFGSWIFLGELITTLELTPDNPLESLCGSCSLCIDACPTGALDEPYTLDATRCISYLTIEKRGDIGSEFHRAIGQHVFGCDDCQTVCPYNAVERETVVFSAEEDSRLLDFRLEDLACLSDEEFRVTTRGSAIARCKPQGLRRNAGIVARNRAGRGS